MTECTAMIIRSCPGWALPVQPGTDPDPGRGPQRGAHRFRLPVPACLWPGRHRRLQGHPLSKELLRRPDFRIRRDGAAEQRRRNLWLTIHLINIS